MNIFVLDENPTIAAQMHCDKHVVKMVLEAAQMLSTAHRVLDDNESDVLYRATHKNHPCSIWVRDAAKNYMWLYNHFVALCDEYNHRYGKVHLTDTKLRAILATPPKNIGDGNRTPFALAMPDDVKCESTVDSYRAYYKQYKTDIATWNKNRPAPEWWK
jgi:hypothetical protein